VIGQADDEIIIFFLSPAIAHILIDQGFFHPVKNGVNIPRFHWVIRCRYKDPSEHCRSIQWTSEVFQNHWNLLPIVFVYG